MPLPQFLHQPRPLRRTMAIAIGLLLVGVGLFLGFRHSFSNWGVVLFLVGLGAALVASGVFLSEERQYWLFAAAVVVNIIGAIVSAVSF